MFKLLSEKHCPCLHSLSASKLPSAIDPERLRKWIEIILQFLPIFLGLFSKPTPAPTPPPVQAGSSITTIDGLLEYVEKQMELHTLSEEQQNKVLNAVDALAAFLAM